MNDLLFCPTCNGPARRERDWNGREVIRCDAYHKCRDTERGAEERAAEQEAMALIEMEAA